MVKLICWKIRGHKIKEFMEDGKRVLSYYDGADIICIIYESGSDVLSGLCSEESFCVVRNLRRYTLFCVTLKNWEQSHMGRHGIMLRERARTRVVSFIYG